MARLSPRQRLVRSGIERGIRLAAPALDLVLFAGEQLSRWAGRNELAPEPARRRRSAPPASASDAAGEPSAPVA